MSERVISSCVKVFETNIAVNVWGFFCAKWKREEKLKEITREKVGYMLFKWNSSLEKPSKIKQKRDS